ncbi:MAG: GNAT family N-acetyltransferase [Acidobacteria bacterium]|nr:MAG: GNAT family N-acetyltransferase [Acidobacteriota bacterium]
MAEEYHRLGRSLPARPSKAANRSLLSKRGETRASFVIRDGTPEDVPAIARLHVVTFRQTHGGRGPTYEIREWQWRQAFANADGNWFCFVIERQNGDLIGFAKGIPYTGDLPDFAGELNKIYLLREYQRLGLGSRLIGYVARRFLSQCIQSMLLFGEARNPSNRFYEALGAERLLTDSGEFHGGYGWRDLRSLEARCPIE